MLIFFNVLIFVGVSAVYGLRLYLLKGLSLAEKFRVLFGGDSVYFYRNSCAV